MALLMAAESLLIQGSYSTFTTYGWADIAKENNRGQTVSTWLSCYLFSVRDPDEAEDADDPKAEVTALLRVLVVRGAPPAAFMDELRQPEFKRVVEEGARLRQTLPAYLARRRALLDAHCPLIPPLLALVRGYDPEPTTTEELWATGLGTPPYWHPPRQRGRRARRRK
jgi:hypothetical protein